MARQKGNSGMFNTRGMFNKQVPLPTDTFIFGTGHTGHQFTVGIHQSYWQLVLSQAMERGMDASSFQYKTKSPAEQGFLE